MKFSLENTHAHRAKNAATKAAEAAQTPDPANPDRVQATLDAMKASRLHKKIWEKGPTLPEILADQNQGPLFKEYLYKKHGVQLDSERVENDLEKIATARVEFLERTEHVEQVKSMITPQMMQSIMQSAVIRQDVALQTLVRTVDAEGSEAVFLDIIHKQLLPLAYKEPERFDDFAKSIEKIAVQKTGEVEKRGRQAEAVLGKYKVKPAQYERIAERLSDPALQTDEAQADTFELIRQTVRSSRIFTGWFMKNADRGLDTWEAKKRSLESTIAMRDDELRERAAGLAEWNNITYDRLKKEDEIHANEPEHASHQRLRAANEELRTFNNETKALRADRARREKQLEFAKRLVPILERLSSKKHAGRVKEAVPNAEALLKEVDEQMQELGSVLKLSFDQSGILRKELGDAQKDANRRRPAPAPIDPEKIGERSAPAKAWRSAYTASAERGAGRRARRNESGGDSTFMSWLRQNFPSLSS